MVNGTGINFSGLASGLDTNAIVSQLVALERIPIQLIESQKDQQQAKLNKINQLADLVKGLQTKAEGLSNLQEFYAFSVGGSFEGSLTVSAGAGAVAGTHTVEVLSTSGTDRWSFDGVADSTTNLAGGAGETVDFTVNGTSYSILVDAGASSLEAIASQINDEAGDDVTATVVNTGTEASPSYKLLLSSDHQGGDGRITGISSSVAGLTIDGTPADVDGNPVSANHVSVGTNAVAIIDGLEITRTTNDFSDVLGGVSLSVLAETTGEVTFTVEPDKDAIKTKIEEFIEAYNEVIDFINTQNTYTPPEEDGEAGTSGVLFGDGLLQSVKQSFSSALFNIDAATVAADTEGYSTLSLIGIKTSSDGTLELNSTTFDEKFDANLEALADLFVDTDGFVRDPAAVANTAAWYQDTTADSGLMATLVRNIDQLFGSIEDNDPDVDLKGIFDLRRDAINSRIKGLNEQIQQKEDRLDDYEQDLIMRFARLEELMGALNAQGASLGAALTQLG
jgi:flagellar hook-associated protein 2